MCFIPLLLATALSVTAGGDAFMVQRFPKGYSPDATLAKWIASGDARLVNFETVVNDGRSRPAAWSGGTWSSMDPSVFPDFLAFGFNGCGCANNHSLDFGFDSLFLTMKTMREAKMPFAGIGENLQEATRAAFIDTPNGRVAFLSVSASFHPDARAGWKTSRSPGRPGLNALRRSTTYLVTAKQFEQIREIAFETGINGDRELDIRTGFEPPDAPGTFQMDSLAFKVADKAGCTSACNKKDLERITAAIAAARKQADLVVVLPHSHTMRDKNVEAPAPYFVEFCHRVIEAGADVVFGGGTHQLKGIEIWNGKPIFYSLGDFVFQNNVVPLVPPDFCEQYDVPLDADAKTAFNARSKGGKVGLHAFRENFLSVVPRVSFENGKLRKIEMLPIELHWKRDWDVNGLPRSADDEASGLILAALQRTSAEFGTKITRREDGILEATGESRAAARLSELPTERPYQFREALETVHRADRRDKAAVCATNEFAFARGQAIVAADDLGEVATRALVDFQDYLRVSMNVDVRTGGEAKTGAALSVVRDASLRPREYTVDVSAEGVVVRAKDGRAAAQALYHLEDLLNLREAPFLAFGRERRRDRFEARLSHSGYGECAFEDAYLAHLAHGGINAIMFFLTDIDQVESLGGYRADNRFDINAIIRRAKRFGLDAYIYCIFHSFAHPRDPGGRETIDRTFGRILGNYPEAKGAILIGESCQFPSKDPRVQPVTHRNKNPKDPRPVAGWFPCSDRAEWLEAVKESVHRRAPNMEIILYTYNWGWAPEEERLKLLDSLPKDVPVMAAWEMFQRRTMPNGIESPTADYTIAVPGAGAYFKSEAARAHRNGLKLYTMSSAGGRTWDFGCVPYIPVPEQWLRRWRGHVEAHEKWGLAGIMENHDWGWLPTFLGEIEKETYAEGGLPYDEHIRKIAARDFGAANAERVVAVWKRWSDEMNYYIPSDVNQYGTFRTGPAYPFVIGKEPVKKGEIPGVNPTCCLRLNYLNTGYVFASKPERVDDEYFRKEIELFEVPIRGYEEGAAAFLEMANGLEGRKRVNALKMANLALYLAANYRTAVNLKQLAIAYRNGDKAGYLAAAKAEYANVKAALDLVSRDSRLGYENNLDYAGGAEQLKWKLRRLERDFGKDVLDGK